MFIGHLALGFAAKRATPRVSLAVLFAASQFADMLWPVLVAIGLEEVRIDPGNTAFTPLDFVSYPYSHSLLMLIVWGIVFAAAYAGTVRLKADTTTASRTTASVASGFSRTFAILAALVVSHWVLDWITHRPDMPLYPGGPKYGLGLWNSMPATMFVEGLMFGIGLSIYLRVTRARDAVGRWGFLSLIALLLVLYVANAGSSPPPSVNALVVMAIIGAAILTAWSWWADAHRDVILTPSRSAGL